ncbi:MAG: hypothetical protein DRH43_03305, partial [Deltaproteobacteria bacterium]
MPAVFSIENRQSKIENTSDPFVIRSPRKFAICDLRFAILSYPVAGSFVNRKSAIENRKYLRSLRYQVTQEICDLRFAICDFELS